MTDYFGNEIKAGDHLLRLVVGRLDPVICVRVSPTTISFTHTKYKWVKDTHKYIKYVGVLSSKQELINCSVLGLDAKMSQEHIDFYNKLKQKK